MAIVSLQARDMRGDPIEQAVAEQQASDQGTRLGGNINSPGVTVAPKPLPPINNAPYQGNAIAQPAGSQFMRVETPGAPGITTPFGGGNPYAAGGGGSVVSPGSVAYSSDPGKPLVYAVPSFPKGGKEDEKPAPVTGVQAIQGTVPQGKPAAGMNATGGTGTGVDLGTAATYIPLLLIGAAVFFLFRK